MKSWKIRLGLILAMLAMVLAVSVPAVADEFDESFFEDELAGDAQIEDVDCDVDDDGWNDDEDDDDDNDGWHDDEDDDE